MRLIAALRELLRWPAARIAAWHQRRPAAQPVAQPAAADVPTVASHHHQQPSPPCYHPLGRIAAVEAEALAARQRVESLWRSKGCPPLGLWRGPEVIAAERRIGQGTHLADELNRIRNFEFTACAFIYGYAIDAAGRTPDEAGHQSIDHATDTTTR